jgi:phage tail sheath gpL-like
MATSTAVGTERISRIVGYQITKGDFSESTPNLPQRIAVLAEANTANQATLSTEPKEILSAQEAGQLYGYGSPIYQIMRILRPPTGGGVGGVPVIVYPQEEADGAIAAGRTITPTGTATGNGAHTIVINGRRYAEIVVAESDNVATICDKIVDAINNVLDVPVIAVDNTTSVTITAKWKGLTSQSLNVTIDTNNKDLGLSYAVTSAAVGAGTPSISDALASFGNNWNTIVINSYDTAHLDTLEAFNGIPDPLTPTGRYTGVIMKPFIALFGSTIENPSSITETRKENVTNAVCPAPFSAGFPMEAAANMATLFARIAQDSPHLDVNSLSYPDMPIPTNRQIGIMATYDGRDSIVKKGCSTVDLVADRYQVQDFVTTYHPDGELPPQFRYCRNLMLDFNVRFGYFLLEQINVVDHAIANDGDVVNATKVIKPKQWKQVLDKYAEDLGRRALVADVPFMQDSIEVRLSATNPDRLETKFKYKRTGVARISSTTAEAGFNFGQN